MKVALQLNETKLNENAKIVAFDGEQFISSVINSLKMRMLTASLAEGSMKKENEFIEQLKDFRTRALAF